MSTSLVVTFTGPDRPGLVNTLAAIVAEHGGSWSDSRMASLAERFAGLVLITVADDAAKGLASALVEGAATAGLRAVVDWGGAAAEQAHQVLALELTGADHEGIVRDVARVLAEHEVNIEEAATETESAPMSGELIFSCVMALTAPVGLDLDALTDALEDLADDILVEINLERASQ